MILSTSMACIKRCPSKFHQQLLVLGNHRCVVNDRQPATPLISILLALPLWEYLITSDYEVRFIRRQRSKFAFPSILLISTRLCMLFVILIQLAAFLPDDRTCQVRHPPSFPLTTLLIVPRCRSTGQRLSLIPADLPVVPELRVPSRLL